jgi:hypothetical protein
LAIERTVRQWDKECNFHPRRLVFSRLEDAIDYLKDLSKTTIDCLAHMKNSSLPMLPKPAGKPSIYTITDADIHRLSVTSRKQYRILLCDPTNGVDHLEQPRLHRLSDIPDLILRADTLARSSLVIVGQTEDDKPRFAIQHYNRRETPSPQRAAGEEAKGLLDWFMIIGFEVFREVGFQDDLGCVHGCRPDTVKENENGGETISFSPM